MYRGYYYGGGETVIYFCLLAAIIFSMWASWSVKHTFKKYSDKRNYRGITGAEAARRVLDRNGLYNVRINQIPGTLSDYYDPKSQAIYLSNDVYAGTSAVAVGVACHEAGHAVQYAEEYLPIKIRAAVIPATNIGSKLAFPLILAGALFANNIPALYYLIYVGIACFAISVVFQLVTLPTEFNASGRAMRAIEETGLLTDEEQHDARKVLSAAAMTYVAALAVAVLQLLRLLAIYGKRRN